MTNQSSLVVGIRKNIRMRLRLLVCALFRRYVYTDIIEIAREYGLEYRDVVGNLEPLQFARQVLGAKDHGTTFAGFDFTGALGSVVDFTPLGEPQYYNSEPSVGSFLGDIVLNAKPGNVVELGCFVGWTSAHLACALKANNSGGRLWCVDCSRLYLDVATDNLKRLGLLESTTMVQGKSLDKHVLSKLPEQIDLLFIDTTHQYPDTLNEILQYTPRVAPNGCIVLHDSISWSGVRRALTEVTSMFRILTFATEKGNGVSVLLRS